MAQTLVKKTKNTKTYKNGIDKNSNGLFVDKRKSNTFHIDEKSLNEKTSLEGIRKTIFTDRYSLKDATGNPIEKYPEQMWARVAKGIAQFEKTPALRKKWEKKFYTAMKNFKFVPAGRILSGAGTGYEVTFFNCYVIPDPKDSREGIMESITQTVEIQARAGGVGLNLSSLRPRGARVKKVNGTSSGPVNWAALYSTANHDVIQQGGSRRGALMLMLHDWHPDVEEFIKVKEDLTKIPGANLSVCVSDSFMEALKNGGDWNLEFPDLDDPEYDEKWNGDIAEWKSLGKSTKVYKTVKARDIWDMIAKAAWTSAEPGLHFLERSNKRSNTHYFEKLVATNPCLTGDSLVSTDKGLLTIKELFKEQNDTKVLVDSRLSGEPFKSTSKVVKTGKKQVYKLATKEGYELRLTANHKVLTENGWKEASSLNIKDRILISNRKGGFGEHGALSEGQILGWLVGDGTMKATEAVLSFFGSEKEELAENFASMVTSLVDGGPGRQYPVGVRSIPSRNEARVVSTRLWKYAFENEIEPGNKLKVPGKVLRGTEDMQRGFLQALFTADGHVSGTKDKGVTARLTSISAELLKDVQRLLLNFGIASKIYFDRRKRQKRFLPDGKGGRKEYMCSAYHDLVISKQNVVTFAKEISFLVDYKNQKIVDWLKDLDKCPYTEKFSVRFKKLIKQGIEDVYDLTEPDTSSFIANGLVVHNCGEQPLGAWSVCNLGAMNLANYVDESGNLKYESLEEDTRVAMRFMDNVVDANFYFYEENLKEQSNIRRTGIGTMGLADALIKMKIPYGSEKSISVIEKIYKTIRDAAYDESANLALEKGPFPKFDKDKYAEGWFVKRLPKNIQNKIYKNGIRNAVILTQAPTGTTSLLSGVSSGIEPVYDFEFKRTDRTGEHIIYHPLFKQWKDDNPNTQNPDYFISAKDLTPEEHLAVQAKIQEFTDSSISKTVNAPEEYTIEDVKRLYTKAYEMGLKGITFFRDGSRTGVLASVEDKKEKNGHAKQDKKDLLMAESEPLIDRPEVATGATYKVNTPVGSAFITINETPDGQPLEVFINIGKAGSDVGAMAAALGRTISTALRLRGDVSAKTRAKEIAKQLAGIGGRRSVGFGVNRVYSLPDAIAQSLNMHFKFNSTENNLINSEGLPTQLSLNEAMKDNSNPHADICPECGASTLVLEEGCAKCYSCGHSEC